MLQLSDRSVLQLHVTAQFYLENKGKYILEVWGRANPKDAKREKERECARARERERPPALWLLFLYVSSSPLGLPCVNWASQECCLSRLRSSLWSSTFLCSIFAGFSLPCLLATAILDSCLLFYLPNKTMAQDGCPTSVIRLAFQSTERRECWGKGCMPTVPRRCDIIF